MAANVNVNLSSLTNESFVCVEYPGIVKNSDKMLQTLGGISHIQKIFNDPSKRLDLRFRPNDPCCKPACADRTSCTSLLLKVCKYRRRNTGRKDAKPEIVYRQVVCGVIDVAYKFSSLCEYQYLPTKKLDGKYVNMMPYLVVEELHQERDNFIRDAPLFIPPPVFTRLDTPQDYSYKSSMKMYRDERIEELGTSSRIGVSRPHRFHNAICAIYEDKVPTEPLTSAVKFFEANSAFLKTQRDEIIKLFEVQPIWPKSAIQAKLELTKESLKHVLPLVAYYAVTGPWRTLWIRFGFDPKTNPEAKKYQLIDFRVRRGIKTPYIPIKAKRSTFSYKLPNLQPKGINIINQPKSVLSTVTSELNETNATSGEKASMSTKNTLPHNIVDESRYVYREGRLPPYRQMFYMACNVHLPEAERLINQSSLDMVCTKENGWFVPKTQSKVREIISKDVYRTIAKMKKEASKDDRQSSERKSSSLSQEDDSQDTEDMDALEDEEDLEEETSPEDQTTQEEEEDLSMEMEEDDKDEFDSAEEEGWFLEDEEK